MIRRLDYVDLDLAMSDYTINDKGCHIYNGRKDKDGYAVFTMYYPIQMYRLNRVALAIKLNKTYEELNLSLHTCHDTSCINGDHLYEGTHYDNNHDSMNCGTNVCLKEKAKTHCPSGHEYNDSNTYKALGSNKRGCTICRQKHGKDYRARMKALKENHEGK